MAEREAPRLVEEKAMKFRKERDTALAELERVQKARSALELELQEHEKSCKNVHSLTWTLHYELLNCKTDLSEAKVECAKIFALLEKKATEAMAPDIPSAEIVRPPRVNRAEKKTIVEVTSQTGVKMLSTSSEVKLPCSVIRLCQPAMQRLLSSTFYALMIKLCTLF